MAQYENLKDYMQLNHLDVISEGIYDYIKSSSDIEFQISDIIILSQSRIALNPDDILTFSLGVSCEKTDADNNSGDIYYYNVMLTGSVSEDFSDLNVLAVEECTQASLIPETVTSMFGLPDIAVDKLEEEADKIHSLLYAFVKRNEEHKYRFEPVRIKEKYKKSDDMHMWTADLDQDVLGQIRFERSTANIYDIADPNTPHPNSDIPANSILLNVKYFRNEIGSDDIITAAHELVHWVIHRDYMKLLQFLDDTYNVMECTSAPITLDDNMSLKEKARWYAEWQANELAIRVAMPKHLVEEAINEYENCISEIHHVVNSNIPHDGNYYENMIYKLHWDFNVPKEIMKKRLRQLGYDYADGTFVIVDGCTYPAFTFANGTLKENETFVIDRDNYERLLRENEEFAELINSVRYIYLGYVVCQVDKKYIDVIINEKSLSFQLTTYAREHADECCIKFAVKSVFNKGEKYVNYGQAYLSNNKNELLQEYDVCIPDDLKEAINSFAKEDSRLNKTLSYCDALAYYLFEYNRETSVQVKDENGDFSYTANRIIDEFAETIGLSSTIIKRYLKNGSPPKLENAMCICFGLGLDETQSREMLKMAGKCIDAPTAENKMCRLIFKLSDEDAREILNHWKACEAHFKECNKSNPPQKSI